MTEDLIDALARQLQKGLGGQGEAAEMDALVQQLRKNMLAQLASQTKRITPKQDDDDEGFRRPSNAEIEEFIIRLQKSRADAANADSTYCYTKDLDRVLKFVQTGDDKE